MRPFNPTFLFISVFIFVSSQGLFAQKGKLVISGKVVENVRKGLGSEIKVYRGQDLINSVSTTGIGKFELDLPLNDSLYFVVTSEGYISKTILAVTNVPDKFAQKEFQFPCFIDLYKIGDTPMYIDLSRPVGKIVFQDKQFIYDLNFTREANRDLREFVKERKSMHVKPAGK